MQFYELSVNKKILDLIMLEISRQEQRKQKNIQETNANEIRKLIPFTVVGIDKLPSVKNYWSSHTALGGHSIPRKVMI